MTKSHGITICINIQVGLWAPAVSLLAVSPFNFHHLLIAATSLKYKRASSLPDSFAIWTNGVKL